MTAVPQERQCKREDCPNRFQVYPGLRGRPKEFCSERCRQIHFTGALEEEVRKAQQCARKYQSSLRVKNSISSLGWRQIITEETEIYLGLLLEKWPHGKRKKAQHEAAWRELREIRQLLWLNPYPNADIARARATALQEVIAPLASKDRTAARIWIYCEEIKRDAGIAGESEEVLNQIETQAKIVEYLWDREHDHLNFAYALLSHANLDRNRLARVPKAFGYKHADRAKRGILDAINVLKGPCYKQDRLVVNFLRHHAALMLYRLEAFQYKNDSAVNQWLDEMKQFEEQINASGASPRTSIETLREEAGYCQSLKGDLDEAHELLQKATAKFQTLDVQPIPAQLGLLRPKLEILHGRNDSSFEAGVKRYPALLHTHPSAYYANQIRTLYREAGYNLAEIGHDNLTIYTTSMMVYLYYEDFSLRREGIL
jgi:hypothetical protein